jgi:hypothetical protein
MMNKSTQKVYDDAKAMISSSIPPSKTTKKFTIDIKAPPEVVFKLFLEYTWKKGGGFGVGVKLYNVGDELGQQCVRRPFYGLREVIVTTNPETKTIDYAIPRGLPVTIYHGIVHFEQLPGNNNNNNNGSNASTETIITRVTWYAKYEPYQMIGTACVSGLVHFAFPIMLRNLKKKAERAAASKS